MIADVAFPIEIYEVADRRPHELTPEEKAKQAKGQLYWRKKSDFFGTDRFSIRRNEYDVYLKDAKRERVEDRLNEVFSHLIFKAFEAREEERRREVAKDLAEQRAKREAEIQRLQAIEKATLAALDAHAINWRKAQDLRALIGAVRGLDEVGGKERDRWLAWAQSQADRIDPLRGQLDQLLHVDFEALSKLRQMIAPDCIDREF